MLSKFIFQSVHKLFQQLINNNLPFGGKMVILSGDFRQILPVVSQMQQTGPIHIFLKNMF